MLEMTHIGDVAHIAHLIAQMTQVAEHDIKGDGRPRMSQMWVSIDGGTAYIHAHIGGMEGFERLFSSGERIVDQKCLFHIMLSFNLQRYD